jgi:hypothetical protein
MNRHAVRFYRPAFYSGTVILITTEDAPQPKRERRRAIQDYAGAAQFISVPGRRKESFLAPAVDALARELQICLGEAAGQLVNAATLR